MKVGYNVFEHNTIYFRNRITICIGNYTTSSSIGNLFGQVNFSESIKIA